MNDRRKLANGLTVKQQRDWKRACHWTKRYIADTFSGAAWHDERHRRTYMGARNGYLAGYKAGHRAAMRSRNSHP